MSCHHRYTTGRRRNAAGNWRNRCHETGWFVLCPRGGTRNCTRGLALYHHCVSGVHWLRHRPLQILYLHFARAGDDHADVRLAAAGVSGAGGRVSGADSTAEPAGVLLALVLGRADLCARAGAKVLCVCPYRLFPDQRFFELLQHGRCVHAGRLRGDRQSGCGVPYFEFLRPRRAQRFAHADRGNVGSLVSAHAVRHCVAFLRRGLPSRAPVRRGERARGGTALCVLSREHRVFAGGEQPASRGALCAACALAGASCAERGEAGSNAGLLARERGAAAAELLRASVHRDHAGRGGLCLARAAACRLAKSQGISPPAARGGGVLRRVLCLARWNGRWSSRGGAERPGHRELQLPGKGRHRAE